MALLEQTVINQIANYEALIAGVKKAYAYSENPDQINAAALPCVVHYCPSFASGLNAHHLQFRSEVVVKSILLVAPREAKGGVLRFLENTAIPFGQKWRAAFTVESTITAIAAATGGIRVFLTGGEYGAGGTDLTYGGVSYIGWVFTFQYADA